MPLVDRLSVVTKCAFSMAAQSYLVRRMTDNPQSIFYMFCIPTACRCGTPNRRTISNSSKLRPRRPCAVSEMQVHAAALNVLLYLTEPARVSGLFRLAPGRTRLCPSRCCPFRMLYCFL